jgi:ribosomal protein S18 acetylase RimI-like enzyme
MKLKTGPRDKPVQDTTRACRALPKNGALKPWLARALPEDQRAFIALPHNADEIEAFSRSIFAGHALSRFYIDYMLGPGHGAIFGLRGGGKIAALLTLEANRRQRRIYITEIAVAPARRGKGHGLWLLESTETIAAACGYRTIACHVNIANAASLMLHRSFGMEEFRLCKRYSDGGNDAWYMRKSISGKGVSVSTADGDRR